MGFLLGEIQICLYLPRGTSEASQFDTFGDFLFLVAPPLPSGATYLVTMASVCMYGCSLVEIFFTKGFFFYTGFGLIHVQTGKKNFHRGPPPPPPQ